MLHELSIFTILGTLTLRLLLSVLERQSQRKRFHRILKVELAHIDRQRETSIGCIGSLLYKRGRMRMWTAIMGLFGGHLGWRREIVVWQSWKGNDIWRGFGPGEMICGRQFVDGEDIRITI